MDEQKIKEVFSDEKFVRELLDMEEPEQVQQALHERGIDFSREEILATRDALIKTIENGGELSEAELENVAGGTPQVFYLVAMVAGLVVGSGLGAGLINAICKNW